MSKDEQQLIEVLTQFEIDSKAISCKPYGNGHINITYEVKTEKGGHYILQQINHNIFKDVNMLMENINYVSSYINNNGFESLVIIKTKEGNLYYKEDGLYFRVYLFTPNSTYFESPTMDIIKETAEAYGDLHKNLSSLDASKIGEVLPNFHNTQKRFENFLEAVSINYKNRKELCQKEIEDIISFKDVYSILNHCIEKKVVNLTVTHNDPKINNVLFDKDTLKFRCVIDLDTVMPGSLLYDFGDGLRSLFTGENECSKDLSKLKVNLKYMNYI